MAEKEGKVNQKLKNEIKFALILGRNVMSEEQKEKALKLYDNGLDWNSTTRFVKKNRIYPIFIKNLKALEIPIDTPGLKKLENKAKEYAMTSMQLASELLLVCNKFEQNDISVIALKGPVLAKSLYGNIALRTSWDLDILIQEKDIPEAIKILEEMGYGWGRLNTRMTSKREACNRAKSRHFSYTKGRMTVEVHWKAPINSDKNFSQLYNEGRAVDFYGAEIKTLSAYDEMRYLVIHGAEHGYSRLRWLFDIYELINVKNMNVKKLYEECSDNSAQLALLVTMYLFEKLGIAISPDITDIKSDYIRIAENLAQLAFEMIVENMETNSSIRYIQYNKKFDEEIMKSHDYSDGFLTPGVVDFELIDLPDSLFWIYYVIRPFYKLYRLSKKRRINKKAAGKGQG